MPDEVSAKVPPQSEHGADEIVSAAPALPVRVGCSDLPPRLRRERYFERLDYLENEGTRFQVPKAQVLRRWRKEAGPDARFGLLAPQVITDRPGARGYARGGQELAAAELAQAGAFRTTPVVERAVQELADACATIEADAVIFRSPADFVPSAANRDVLRRFFTELASAERFGTTARVWEPQGLWELEVAGRLAAELGLVCAWDPLSNDPLFPGLDAMPEIPDELVYFRITGLGQGRQRFDEYSLEPLVERAAEHGRAWIVFTHIHKYPDAIRCRRLLQPDDSRSDDSQ